MGEVAETPATDAVIRSVETSEMVERFLDVYLAGWGFPLAIHEGAKANMRGWLGLPGWHLYLAEIDTQAAAIAAPTGQQDAARMKKRAARFLDTEPLQY